MPDQSEKTEAPTPRRRQEAREEGNVARSTDLTAAVTLLGGVVLLGWFGTNLLAALKHMMRMFMSGDFADSARGGDLGSAWTLIWYAGGEAMMPLVGGLVALAILISVMQVGFLVTLKPLQPKFSKLSPIRGTQQLFSKRSAMRLAMALGKVAIVGAVAAFTIWQFYAQVLGLTDLAAVAAFAAAAELVYILAFRVAITLIVLAVIDYCYQRWQHEQDMKMTKQEVKEEFKRMEGDPMIKQRRARVARQLAMQRIAQAVPRADVVVTNPTHFAVALQYDGEQMGAPKVVAKGADFLALRIRQLAASHGVPIVERKALARALYRTVEVGQEIPAEHYAAVAEILAYVYRLSGKKIA